LDAKLSAITKALEETNARSAGLENSFQQIISMNAKPAPKEEMSPYDADFAEKVALKAAQEAARIAEGKIAAERARQAVIGTLAMDYPELGNTNSEFSQAMVKAHNQLSASLKETPEGYRLAAREAAAQLGIVPKSKRKESDDFSMSSSNSTKSTPTKPAKKVELDDLELGAAELLGLNVNDKKLIENMTKHKEQRQGSWTKYR
jgi:hypothetical protein